MSQSTQEEVRFVRFPELQEILGGVSRATVERAVANGELPHPFKFGKRMVAWKFSEIMESLALYQRVPASSYKSRSIPKFRRTK